MPNLRDIVLARKEVGKGFEQYRKIVRCEMAAVDFAESCDVDGREGFSWVREYGSSHGVFQVWNPGVEDIVGLPVLVGFNPKSPYRREIIKVDFETLAPWMDGDPGDFTNPKHHTSHEWPDAGYGTDAVNVYPRALVMLRCQPFSGLILLFYAAIYTYNGYSHKFNGEYVNANAYLPAAGNCVRVLFYLDPDTDTIAATASDEVVIGNDPDYVDAPLGKIPSAWVYIEDGDTAFVENDITDARSFLDNYAGMGSAGEYITFISLSDTPAEYDGLSLYAAIVNDDASGLKFARRGLSYSEVNVSNPPTNAELVALLGTAFDVGAGYAVVLNDNGAGANEYLIWSDGSNWWHVAGTKAV